MTYMTYREAEKGKYQGLKNNLSLFSAAAQLNGTYRGRTYPFCLADEHSDENLYMDIRKAAIDYFALRGIPWHDGLENRTLPSNHLCCSQSCCVNFLFPMSERPDIINKVFSTRSLYPEMLEPLPFPDGTLPYVVFEWIGIDDYLNETRRKPGRRTRGANYTSADFAFRFRRKD